MASVEIMPKLGLTMTVGTLVKWHVAVNDAVKKGGPIADIETDKLTHTIEASQDGIVLALLVDTGSERPITQPICVIGEVGEDISRWTAPKAERDVQVQAAAPVAAPVVASGERVAVTPIAKRMAAERGIDLALIKGTGPGGRITREDVEAYSPAAERTEKLAGVRKVIADRLSASKREIPHTYIKREIVMDGAYALRDALGASLGRSVSVNSIILMGVAMALEKVPALNANMQGDSVVFKDKVDLGIAVDAPSGLIVPVLRNATRLSAGAFLDGIAGLIARARDGATRPEDIGGGSFTVSNLGGYGVDEFTAIINPPEVAILAVGRARERFVIEGGAIRVCKTAFFTVSIDHRALDGAQAAKFLGALSDALNDIEAMKQFYGYRG